MSETPEQPQRKKPGPPPGRVYSVPIPLRVTLEMDRDIVNYANQWKLPKAEAVRDLIRRGLRSR